MDNKLNLIAGLLFIASAFIAGYINGASKYKIEMLNVMDEFYKQSIAIQKEIDSQEIVYAQRIQEKEEELDALHESFISTVNSFSGSFASRLLESENRASHYKSLSRAGTDGCEKLARVTEAYDRNLTRGIDLVSKLAAATEISIRQSTVMIEAMEIKMTK